MGQNQSNGAGCIVEVAPKSMVNAWSTPRPQATVAPPTHWRIVVNPQDELYIQEQEETFYNTESRPPLPGSSTRSLCSSNAEYSGSTDLDLSESEESTTVYEKNRVTKKKGKYQYEKLSSMEDISDTRPRNLNHNSRQSFDRQNLRNFHKPIKDREFNLDLNPDHPLRPQVCVQRHENQGKLTKLQLMAGSQGFSSQQYRSLLNSKIDQLYGCSKVLTSEEAKCLVLAAEQRDKEYLLKTLTTISTLAAFTVNQDEFRRYGLIDILEDLLEMREDQLSDSTRVMLIQCISNMAVNRQNQALIKGFMPILVDRVQSDYSPELEKQVAIQCLINLTLEIENENVQHLQNVIPYVYNRLWMGGKVNLPMLKLLVNISCCSALVPKLLASKAPPGIRLIFQSCIGEETLVRSTVLLQYLLSTTLNFSISEMLNCIHDLLHAPDPQSANSKYPQKINHTETVFHAFFGPAGQPELHRCLLQLRNHRNPEIETRIGRILPDFEDLTRALDEQSARGQRLSTMDSSRSASTTCSSTGSPL